MHLRGNSVGLIGADGGVLGRPGTGDLHNSSDSIAYGFSQLFTVNNISARCFCR